MIFVEHILWGGIVFKGKRIPVWLVYLSPSQYLKLGLMYGMVAVKHTFCPKSRSVDQGEGDFGREDPEIGGAS